MKEFDVWGNACGSMMATPANARFVFDDDAPYSYDCHVLRCEAQTGREAVKTARFQSRSGNDKTDMKINDEFDGF